MNHIHESARMPTRPKQLELRWLLIHFRMNLKFWITPLSIESSTHTTEIHQTICQILNATLKNLYHRRSYSYIMFRCKYSLLEPSLIMASHHKKEKRKHRQEGDSKEIWRKDHAHHLTQFMLTLPVGQDTKTQCTFWASNTLSMPAGSFVWWSAFVSVNLAGKHETQTCIPHVG